MASSCPTGCTNGKKVVTQEGGGAQKLGELSDAVSYAVRRRLHTLAFTGSRWVAFADPVQELGWLVTSKFRLLTWCRASSTRFGSDKCPYPAVYSYVPGTKNVVVSERYTLKTSNIRPGVLKMVSEFSPAGIIGVGLPTSTIPL